MASFLDVVRFVPTAGGTTDWTYSSAVTGYQSPSAGGVVNGSTYRYRAESADLSQWEVGTGTYNTGTGVLTRGTVLYNSAGTGTGSGQSGAGTKINFSTTPQVGFVVLAEDLSASPPAFFARLSANQTGVVSATPTKILYDTTNFNVGTYFDAATNHRWTPPAGTVTLSAGMYGTGTIASGSSTSLFIYKNGSQFTQTLAFGATGSGFANVTIIDRANGTDYYEVYAYITTTAGTVTLVSSGPPYLNYFQGVWNGP